MSQYCYSSPTRTETIVSTATYRSTSFRTSTFTRLPTGTQITGALATTRIPSVTSYVSEYTYRSYHYGNKCTTYPTRVSYPYYGSFGVRVPTGIIIIAVLVGLWYLIFIGVGIYLVCCSKTAKRERQIRKGRGGINQNQMQNLQPQLYTPVPQDALYSRGDTQYPIQSNLPYGVQQNLTPSPQTTYTSYQNYNAPNVGMQGANQWSPQNPSTPSSYASGPGPGYIPPGAAHPMIGSPSAGTVSYSMTSTTPSPPPGPPGGDPHRLLYTQQNDRLSAAVSLVHPYQSQDQPSLSYPNPTSGPPPFAQPHQTSSQTQLAAQYRGYAEPSTLTNNNNNNEYPARI